MQEDAPVYRPLIYDMSLTEDQLAIDQILLDPHVTVIDTLDRQLKELIKVLHPQLRLTDDEYTTHIQQHLGDAPLTAYGKWVYYPWTKRLIHLLGPEEFILLRTSANRHKITEDEYQILKNKRIGVVGLSVGQSVSLTLAMERGCGGLKLADFDTVELNNLNRLRVGVHQLGLLKAYVVAREIAEIDPYFPVECYTEGINKENIFQFFTEGGKLDLVIDECDNVAIKVMIRLQAKELSIPVLMEASDRGTLDVERFDLNPNKPIMHGWLEHLSLDIDQLLSLNTAAEKLPYILPISGLDTLSTRMKASMIEIQQSITTWPQLASAVALGGALTADTARRIFLNQFSDSGRYFIDLENLIRDPKPKPEYAPIDEGRLLHERDMIAIGEKMNALLPPTDFTPDVRDISLWVQKATKAPSHGNTQPWRWYYDNGLLCLFAEAEDRLPFDDYKFMSTYMANGAALTNLELAVHSKGYGTLIHTMPLPDEPMLVATIQFTRQAPPPEDELQGLCECIDFRYTNRSAGTKSDIDPRKLSKLKKSVQGINGAELLMKDKAKDIAKLAHLVGACERLRLLHPMGHYDHFNRLRWSNDEIMRMGEGIHIDSYCLSQQETIALKLIKKQEVAKFLSSIKGGQALGYGAQQSTMTSGAIGLLAMPERSAVQYVLAGRALQRMWLTATKIGLSIHPLQSAVTQFTLLKNGSLNGYPIHMEDELMEQFTIFNDVFKEIKNKAEVFMFRVSIANETSVRTVRKQTEKVLLLRNK